MTNRTLIKLETKDGTVLETELDPPGDVDSFFVFSLHKAGSTLLNNMLHAVCRMKSIPIFEPEIVEFKNGVPLGTLKDSVQEFLVPRGYCYSGFRCYRPFLDGLELSPFNKIILIRDPRDMIVSHYYSQKFSHQIPGGKLGQQMQAYRESLAEKSIDDYAIEQAPFVSRRFKEYQQKVMDSNCRLYRYEDVIFNKTDWLRSMMVYLGIDLSETEIKNVSNQFDVKPQGENPGKHVRKVTPGDHIEKLQPEVISQLNEILADVLTDFQYAV